MNIVILLAGGIGSRMGITNAPKQYLMAEDKPIIVYSIEIFAEHPDIDYLIIVADKRWRGFIKNYMSHLTLPFIYAEPGKTRQESIFNGLKKTARIAKEDDIVIIHDAARPLVNNQLIAECVIGATEKDGAMPVLPVKDTIYLSENGNTITGLLKRAELYAGQTPESFKFGKYYNLHNMLTKEEIQKITGSSEIAFKYNMDIKLIKGEEDNFKITTMEDYNKFLGILEKRRSNYECICARGNRQFKI